MQPLTFALHQAAQQRVPGGIIALYGAASNDGQLGVELGISTARGAQDLAIAVGSSASIPGFGTIDVVDVHVGGPGSRTKALISFTPAPASHP